jgi:lipopolysaccharide/colanic/teichoic acid biosynthesis glycosyltransferase
MTAAKRGFDVFWAALGLVVLSPLLAFAALLILLDDGRPVLFRQLRAGERGRPFRIWKFRTMVRHADRLGGSLTVGRDPRITRVGHWLRRSKLDELPQLLNVLTGDMSLVGPRPEVFRYVERYDAAQRRVLELRPGITDPASIRYRHEAEMLADARDPEQAYVSSIMPAKIELNLQYAATATVWGDLGIILQTLGAVLAPSSDARATASRA